VIQATGEPVSMGYCHCSSCRSWSGAPVSAFTLWPEQAVKVTKGFEEVATYNKTELSHRKFCRACGGHLMVHIPLAEMTDILPAMFPELTFVPKFARQLCRDCTADTGWLAQAQRLRSRVRRVRRSSPRVSYVNPRRDGIPQWVASPSITNARIWGSSSSAMPSFGR
jgi:hypothetical protein